MKKQPIVSILMVAVAVAGLLGCGLFSQATEAPQQATLQPGEPGTAPTNPAEAALGNFDLSKPAIGLYQLAGYRAQLAINFKGTRSGKAYETSSTITRSSTVATEDYVTEMDYAATDEKPFYLLSGKVGGQVVTKSGRDAQCQTTVDPALTDLGEIPDPASLLLPVHGAVQAGEESVGQVAALHYKFDGRALQLSNGAATGEVWIAKEGGWVVKYALQVQAPVGVLGAGLEGVQTWTYEAAPVQAVSLPEGCSAALDGYPLLADAKDLARMNGAIHYTSASGLDAAVAFYKDQMKAAGWDDQQAFPATADQAILVFSKAGEKDQQLVSIALRSKGGALTVDIQEIIAPLPPTPAAGAPQVPGLPGMPEIPGLPTP